MTSRLTRVAAVLTAAPLALALTACSSEETVTAAGTGAAASTTISIEDNHGTVEVPASPQHVIALDNRVFETLSSWDIPLVAAPKGLMGQGLWPEYVDDEGVLDVGTHREPNLESVVAAEPDLIIGGMRFADHYGDLVAQNPDAAVVELS